MSDIFLQLEKIFNKGFSCQKKGDHQKAEDYYQKFIDLYETSPEAQKALNWKSVYLTFLYAQGLNFYQQGEYEKSNNSYKECVNEYSQLEEKDLAIKIFYLYTLYRQGVNFYQQGEYEKSNNSYKEFVNEYSQLEEKDLAIKRKYLFALYNQYLNFAQQGKYEATNDSYEKFFNEYSQLEEKDLEIKGKYLFSLYSQGLNFYKQGKYKIAQNSYEKFFNEYSQLEEKDLEIKRVYLFALYAQGGNFHKQGNYEAANDNFELCFNEYIRLNKEEYLNVEKVYLFALEILAKNYIAEGFKNKQKWKTLENNLKDIISNKINKQLSENITAIEEITEKKALLFEKEKLFKISRIIENYIDDIKAISKLPKKNLHYITKLKDIVNIVNKFSNKKVVFRGMNRAQWELNPSYYRSYAKEDELKRLITHFQREAMSLSDLNFDHYEKIDWLSLMQHHGCLSPFLDWSQACNIALFFAIYNTNKYNLDNDGIPCLVAFNYDEIFSYDKIKEEMLEKDKKDYYLFAPKLSHKRASLQRSLFTYHTKKDAIRSKKDAIRLSDKFHYFIISPSLKKELLRYLEVNGLTPTTIYADLDHFSDQLKDPSYQDLSYATLSSQETEQLDIIKGKNFKKF